MELRNYLRFIQNYKLKLILPTLVLSLVTALASFFWPASFEASATIFIQKVPEQSKSGDYSFDGYYAQQMAESYTDTVEGFLASLDILRRAAQIANLPSETSRLTAYRKKIKVERVAPQLVEVRVNLNDAAEAKQLITALVQAARERASALNQAEEGKLLVNVLAAEPLLQIKKPWLWLNTFVAFGASLLVSLTGLTFWYYLKDED